MKYVYILEDDPKFRDDIVEAVQKVDSQLAVRCFNSLESFAKWIKLLLAEGASSLSKGGQALPHLAEQVVSGSNDQLLLLICKNEFFGSKNMPLLQKTRELFITKGLCPPHEPTSLVITTFEDPDFDIKVVGDRIINNVIFKPFDKLILQQHLAFAISGRRPPSQYTIHNVKTTTTIEMLKDVEIEAISDVGFVSRSNRQIPVGALAKYYSPSFVSQKKQISMLATCVFSSPHPDYKDHFRCAFSYVAADPFQISNLRKEARKKEAKPFPFEWLGNVPKEPVHVAIICGDDEATIHFKTSLEKFFSNIKVHLFPHLQTFIYAIDLESAKKNKTIDLASLPPVPTTFHAIFAEDSHFEGNYKDRWIGLSDILKKTMAPPTQNLTGRTEFFMLASKSASTLRDTALGEVARDVFFTPLDPMYIVKKMLIFMPQLNPTEEFNFPTVHNRHTAKVVTPIEISEFSEAGLVMKYYRPISLGAFRDFVLWLPHQLDLPEFLATCNYSEESKSEKGIYFNHFVFFGMNDHFLKQIRRWILQNHVQNKQNESA